MGDFPVPNEYKYIDRCTYVDWHTPKANVVYVKLRDWNGGERVLKHLAAIGDYQQAKTLFDQYIAAEIDEYADHETHPLNSWQEVTKSVPCVQSEWKYVFSWSEFKKSKHGSVIATGLVLYHLNPPSYEFDTPYQGSSKHEDWFESTAHHQYTGMETESTALKWPFNNTN